MVETFEYSNNKQSKLTKLKSCKANEKKRYYNTLSRFAFSLTYEVIILRMKNKQLFLVEIVSKLTLKMCMKKYTIQNTHCM